MEAFEPTTVGLPAELKTRLEKAAAEAGCPVDDVIRDVLQRAVSQHQLRVVHGPPVAGPLCSPELAAAIDHIYPGSGWG